MDERDLHISVLTLAEYDKGIANLTEGTQTRPATQRCEVRSKRDFVGESWRLRIVSCDVGETSPVA